jgi:hypothetical protein
MLLASALATERAVIPAQVRVLAEPEFIAVID